MKKVLSVFVVASIILACVPFALADNGTARIIDTVYPTDDLVIADYVVTESPYNADPSGWGDSTAAIQKAINDCAASGGGTVFMPAGRYRLTGSVNILPFVTLRGDWQDPDLGGDYGTLIVADVESKDDIDSALLRVGGSAGAVGLTVWYPDQSLENVLPYPYTFLIDGVGDSYMLQSIINCTMLNSYRGIGASTAGETGQIQVHEMLNIENVKGTFLSRGLTAFDSADIDIVKGLHISPKYWAQSGRAFNAPKLEKLAAYTRKNTVGLALGDLEWPQFSDIHVSDCRYGIRFYKGARFAFAGEMTDVYITDCDYGIYAPDGTIQKACANWGLEIAGGVIEGSTMAVYKEDSVSGFTFFNVKTKGMVWGANIRNTDSGKSNYTPDYGHTYKKPASKLYTVNADKSGMSDASSAVQQTLDRAARTGGAVYLPAGIYRFDSPVTVPAGVELRGSSSVPVRSGTLIVSNYGYLDEIESGAALITLKENAGVNGLKINFVKNNPVDASGKYKRTVSAIKSVEDGVYVVNTSVVLSSRAVEFDGCSNAFIKRLVSCCYETAILINNCDGCFAEGCLQNATAVCRTGYEKTAVPELQNWVVEQNIFDYIFIPVTRVKTDYITVLNSKKVTVLNTFIYGGKSFMRAENSDVLAVNVAIDGSSKTEYSFILSGGEVSVVNFMHSTSDGKNGIYAYTASGTKLKLYNRNTVQNEYTEFTVIENVPFNELSGGDIKAYIFQPFIKMYTKFGESFTVAYQQGKIPKFIRKANRLFTGILDIFV